MAAIDTSKEYEPADGDDQKLDTKRCVLKLIRISTGLDDEDSDFDSSDDDYSMDVANGDMSDSEEDSEGEQVNGGPSDPEKSKKARKEAAMKALKGALADAGDDMDIDGAVAKGKGKSLLGIADSDEDDSEDDDDDDYQSPLEVVLCTLDPDNVSGRKLRSMQMC